MDLTASPRPGRRSFPNLTHLSLAPLSSRFPIDDDAPLESHDHQLHDTPRSSYLQPRSTPSTPSILSRSNSRVRLNARSSTHRKQHSRRSSGSNSNSTTTPTLTLTLDGNPNSHTTTTTSSRSQPQSYAYKNHTWRSVPSNLHSLSLTKVKSASAVLDARTRKPPPRQRRYHHHDYRRGANDGEDEWLHRAGLVIASSARDAKGQSWLATRSSSTSLVDAPSRRLDEEETEEDDEDGNDDDDDEEEEAYTSSRSQVTLSYGADDEYSPVTPRYPSRVASARPSRRGSKVGSRVELRTPAELRMTGAAGVDYFGVMDDDDKEEEPDFVELEEGDSAAEDEEVVDRLTRERSFGLGGWVDRLVNWTLFEEDGELSEEEEEDAAAARQEAAAEMARRKEAEEQRRRERIAELKREEVVPEPAPVNVPDSDEQEGGWQDAAWLLSVASKVLL